MRRLWTSSFLKSLVLISSVIGIIPVLLLGYLSYNKSASIVQEEVTAGNRLILQQNKEQVESHLRTIDTLATQMIGGPVTTNAVSVPTVLDLSYAYEHKKLFDSLIYKLVQIQVFELGIRDVHLISFRKNWIVEGGAVYPMEDRSTYAHDEYLLQVKERLTSYRDVAKRSYWKLTEERERGFVLKLIKHIPLNSSDPYGLVSVNVPVSELAKRLTGGGQLGTVVVADERGMILSHPDKTKIGAMADEESYYGNAVSRPESDGQFTGRIGGEDYAVIFNRSTYNGWTYFALTPLESLTVESDRIKMYTMFSVAILIALVVATSLIASLRMYSPIRRIYRFMKPGAPQPNGSENELTVIGDRMFQLAQSETRLTGQVERLNRQAREFYVYKLLLGSIKPEELEEDFEKYGYPADWNQWCLAALRIDTLEGTRYEEKDIDLLLYAAYNIFEEMIPPGDRLSPVIHNRTLLVFLGAPMDRDIPFRVQVFQQTDSVRQHVKEYLKLKVSIGISRSYADFIHAPHAYEESLDALAYRTRLGQESILFIDEAQPDPKLRFRYPKELEARILEAVRRLDRPQAIEGLRTFVERFFENEVNHYDYQAYVGRLFTNVTGVVQDAGGSVQEVFRKTLFTSDILQRMHAPEQILQWFEHEVLLPLIDWMEERARKQEVNISKEIIEEIERNYDQDLSVDMFASRLNYHPSYISRVFKKDTGVTFTEYLSEYRIEVSKRWLRETDMKIAEIAERLRYSTASNFNRNFKRIVKITPSQYREQAK